MTKGKKLGIWMDHSSAHVTEFATTMTTTIIESKFTSEEKSQTQSKGETTMHHAQQHEQASYYKRIGEVIRGYEEVLLFGPTDAKLELFNILMADHLFAGIKIEVKQSDKLTDSQQHIFIREFFSNHLAA